MELHDTLAQLARLIRPTSYLEVGVRDGESLECVLNNCGSLKRICLCDTWGNEDGGTGRGTNEHIKNLMTPRELAITCWLNGSSHLLLRTVDATFQLITVDGDHSKGGALEDLVDCWNLLEPNGFLLFDDIMHPAHPYLRGLVEQFVLDHTDARLVQHIMYLQTTFGCSMLQKVIL